MGSSLIGRTLSHYRVTAKIGEGGMGEVYRATDTTLEREVALKVLPEAFVADADRLARFEREAKLLAQLNHSNIAQIFGVETSGDTRALVMELVEGPTLAERLEHGSLTLEESLSIAHQIVDALEEAHEKGIVHRDLKPQNVKAPVEGRVKVLDFGLAKALDLSSSGSAPGSVLAASPTITLGATIAGVILGTAAYMAPEQAKGLAVDKRADIWAFGVVLYEMLVGRRLFVGETVPDTLAGVLRAEIDLGTLPESTPAALRRLLARCLERNPKNRLRDIGEARLALAEAEREAAQGPKAIATEPVPPPASRRALVAISTLAIVAGIAAVVLGLALVRQRASARVSQSLRGHFEISPPPGATLEWRDGPVAVSNDGRRLAFALRTENNFGLAVREMDGATVKMVPQSDGAYEPFWSADGRALGFCGPQLMRWDVDSDARPIGIAAASDCHGASWSPRGVILYAPTVTGTLMVIPAAGGTPKPATRLDAARGERGHTRPQFLPDGRHFIYWSQNDHPEESALYVGDLDSEVTRRVVALASPARFAAPATLLFLRGTTLLGQTFDPGDFTLAGDPYVVTQGVQLIEQYQNPAFSVSSNGVLAFHSPGPEARPAMFDRTGKRGADFGETGDSNLDLSPDGGRLALNAVDALTKTSDIWVIDLARKVRTRITFTPENDFGPVWSVDGERLYFVSGDGTRSILRVTRASGVGGATDIMSVPFRLEPIAAFPDGRHLLVEAWPPGSEDDLEVVDVVTGARQPFVATPAHEESGRVSPDGRLVAYQSSESGRGEIYVQPYPATGQRWQISNGGGSAPRWRGDGRELVFSAHARELQSVAVGPGPQFGQPVPLFRLSANDYVLTRDGQSVIATVAGDEVTVSPIQILVGWNQPRTTPER